MNGLLYPTQSKGLLSPQSNQDLINLIQQYLMLNKMGVNGQMPANPNQRPQMPLQIGVRG